MSTKIRPWEYQKQGVNQLVKFIGEGYKRIVFQLPTGGGKTVCFSYFLQRYFKAFPSNIAKTLVHREELQTQTLNTFKKFDIDNVPVYMVETFNNQLKRGNFHNTQLIIIDECHIGNFRKVFDYFPDAIIIGFSATPISSSKKHPLKGMYDKIIVCTDIRSLIELHDREPEMGLVRARHYSPENDIDKTQLKRSGDDYTMESMGRELSKPKLIESVLHHYKELGEGGKAIIFNSTIEHNEKVNKCFTDAGMMSRTIDSENVTKEQRKEIFRWFKETPGAILQNVGIATTGFDEPSIINVIPNRPTLSLSLWHQMVGRGARPYAGKDYFNVIDLVGNVAQHGRWDARVDWVEMFYNPGRPGNGAAPLKNCPNDKVLNPDGSFRICGCMIPMSATVCEYCGFLMPRNVVYTDIIVALKLVPDDLVVPRNSPVQHEKTVSKIAEKIANLPNFDRSEKLGMLEQGIMKLNRQSDYRMPENRVTYIASKNIPL